MCNFTTSKVFACFFFSTCINRGAVQRNTCDLCSSTVFTQIYGYFVGKNCVQTQRAIWKQSGDIKSNSKNYDSNVGVESNTRNYNLNRYCNVIALYFQI